MKVRNKGGEKKRETKVKKIETCSFDHKAVESWHLIVIVSLEPLTQCILRVDKLGVRSSDSTVK